MSHDDALYFERRAEAELELARHASHHNAVQAHYQLATAYLDRIHGDTPQAGPNVLSA